MKKQFSTLKRAFSLSRLHSRSAGVLQSKLLVGSWRLTAADKSCQAAARLPIMEQTHGYCHFHSRRPLCDRDIPVGAQKIRFGRPGERHPGGIQRCGYECQLSFRYVYVDAAKGTITFTQSAHLIPIGMRRSASAASHLMAIN